MKAYPVLSSKKITLFTLLALAIPLLTVLLIFDFYTIQKQTDETTVSYRNSLIPYKNTIENSLRNAEVFLANTVSSANLQAMSYAHTRTDTHLAAMNVLENCSVFLKADPLLGGFMVYAKRQAYYWPSFSANYPPADQQRIKDFVIASSQKDVQTFNASWMPLKLSDHTVLIRTAIFPGTVCAAVVDPSRDLSLQNQDIAKGLFLFCTSSGGEPYTPLPAGFSPDRVRSGEKIITSESGTRFLLVKEPIAGADLQLVHASRYQSVFEQLDAFQSLLILASVLLILLLPMCWRILRRKLFQPLEQLTGTIHRIELGNLTVRVPETSRVYEVQEFSHTFNLMLDQITNLKILSYEQKMETQQAQLQYLQLQLRPHFYLNCLKVLYGLAEERQYAQIQGMILALSEYLRYIFRDNRKLVPLASELHSVENYITLQKAGAKHPPALALSIAAEAADLPVPPLSLLTFVENALKHFKNIGETPKIELQAAVLYSGDGNFLNLTVRDNGGGFSQKQLQKLNDPSTEPYQEHHVGISNIRQRLNLIYEGRASLSFTNCGSGGCVELFLPFEEGKMHQKEDPI